MKKLIKWCLIGFGIFFILIASSLIIIPKFVNIEKYKPYVENKISEAMGRQVKINGNLNISFFPWAGLSFSDLTIKNTNGFKEKNFLTIKSFKVKMKLLPLLSKKIKVKELIIDQPHLFLEKKYNGHGNWEYIGKEHNKILTGISKKNRKKAKKIKKKKIEIKSLFVNKIAVKNGFILWRDDKNNDKKEISGLSFTTDNISFENPVNFSLKAKLNGYLMSVKGETGKFLKDKKQLPFDLKIKFAELINIKIKGKISDVFNKNKFELKLNVSEFSPKKLISLFDKKFSIITSDPSYLTSMDINMEVSGDNKNILIKKGIVDIDKSKVKFSADLKELSVPYIAFNINLDNIDFDKYLPPSEPDKLEQKQFVDKQTDIKANNYNIKEKKTDYALLRKIIVNGKISVGYFKIHGGKIENLNCKIHGENGVFYINPVVFNLYRGSALSSLVMDLRKSVPEATVKFNATGIKTGPMLNDFADKDFIEGTLKSDITLTTAGNNEKEIKKHLNGKGYLVFNDGAIVGIDIPGMVHNLKASFGFTKKNRKKARTDFSELYSPFIIKNSIVDISGTSMLSPLLRVKVTGNADLVKEKVNLRVNPKFVATLKGQGDTKKHSGFIVPVLVKGYFNSLKFIPDLKGMIKLNFGGKIPKISNLKKLFDNKKGLKVKSESTNKKVDNIFNGFFKKYKKKNK